MEQSKKERMGFFRRVFLAITDFRLYPFVQRENVKVAVAYFTLLIVLYSAIMAIILDNKLLTAMNDLLYDYDERIPNFTFSNGILDVNEKTYETVDSKKIVIDTSMSNEEFFKTDVGKEILYSKSFVIINQDGIINSKQKYLYREIFTS